MPHADHGQGASQYRISLLVGGSSKNPYVARILKDEEFEAAVEGGWWESASKDHTTIRLNERPEADTKIIQNSCGVL
ncbi:hypothetical protein K432DRAFT_59846 [Lepidopterella palustris CBS 459.81]|uniref:Uncharacterized protein n=1 Tax=Lepidopterella palustris CBS 459.81 TaxID=1314670 RepID=A0A8E2E9G6_9PEZI|nr:hypothetical protein K432DRAFT_59846 [Lepidopterella palustris CBS 459.81]